MAGPTTMTQRSSARHPLPSPIYSRSGEPRSRSSHPLPRIKNAAVFQYRVPIRHACDVVSDCARAPGLAVRLLGAMSSVAMFRGHEVHVIHEGAEELRDDAA